MGQKVATVTKILFYSSQRATYPKIRRATRRPENYCIFALKYCIRLFSKMLENLTLLVRLFNEVMILPVTI